MASYFTSDYHFGHANVIKYDNRPFKNVGEMDEALIENHNSVISDEDDFYFLGDFSFSKTRTEEYLQRLNGNKFFIKGNHDGHNIIKLYKDYGTYLGELAEVDVSGQRIVLCHYAMRVWNKSHRGNLMLYGHSHDSLERTPWGKSMDVGVCSAARILGEWRPFSFTEIDRILSKREIHEIDHHVAK